MLPDKKDLIPLTTAGELLPGNPGHTTLWHWTRNGVLRRGERVYLRYCRVGRTMYTTRQWLADFLEVGCGPGEQPDKKQDDKPQRKRKRIKKRLRPVSKREREVQRAESELSRRGA